MGRNRFGTQSSEMLSFCVVETLSVKIGHRKLLEDVEIKEEQ
jgi:hypothetical protein